MRLCRWGFNLEKWLKKVEMRGIIKYKRGDEMIRKYRIPVYKIPTRRIAKPLRQKTSLSIPRPQLYSPKEKLQKCSWLFKVGDPDDHPSVPHAHDKEHGYRLDAWTGNIYPKGNERNRVIGKLSRQELSRLHSDPKFLEYAKKQIEWYREKYPNILFYVPDWFETSNKVLRVKMGYKSNKCDIYVFLSKAVINE